MSRCIGPDKQGVLGYQLPAERQQAQPVAVAR